MVAGGYVPKRGEVVWLDFSPQSGREQAGRRPAIVLTPEKYNRLTGRCVCVPVTSQIKGYPFELELPASANVSGVALADHVKNQDWRSRNAEFVGVVDGVWLDEAVQLIGSLLEGV